MLCRSDLDPYKSVWENITGGHETLMLGSRPVNSRAYVSRFNFNGADQQKKVGVLSGGERNRAHLAITLKKDANVLLLDEPTNDIDVNTLRSEEHTSELQSLMRISYAVFCLIKKIDKTTSYYNNP